MVSAGTPGPKSCPMFTNDSLPGPHGLRTGQHRRGSPRHRRKSHQPNRSGFPGQHNHRTNRRLSFCRRGGQPLLLPKTADGIPLWQSVFNEKLLGQVALKEKNVYFTCRDGWLYVSLQDQRLLQWKYQTAGIPAGVIIDKNQCFLPSTDTALRCFQADSGRLLWKHLAGGSLTELPVLTDSAVYQPVDHAMLLCLNRTDGSPRWTCPNGRALLAEHQQLSYVITNDKKITIMDNQAARPVLSFHVSALDLYAPNTQNNMIFLANTAGKIVALKPQQ